MQYNGQIDSLGEIEDSALRLGYKAAANQFFKNNGLFSKPLAIFPGSISIEEIKARMAESDIDLHQYAIRFSYKNEVNMPRGFFSSFGDGLAFIREHRKQHPSATIITHSLILPVVSYEVYIDNDSKLIQLLPGIWEMENLNIPDMILIDGKDAKIYRYVHSRRCKYLNSDQQFYHRNTEPFKFDQLNKAVRSLIGKLSRISSFNSNSGPIFYHVIEDDQQFQYFINLRKTTKLDLSDMPSVCDINFHELKTAEDIDDWDGTKAILFNVVTEREDSDDCILAIKRLKEKDVKNVYVRFGVLSHPAILLREHGVQANQYQGLYEVADFTLDV